MTWLPLSRRGTDATEYEGPFEDIPEWLFGPLWSWCVDRIPMYDRGTLRRGAVDEFRAIAVAMRFSLDDPAHPDPRDARGLKANLLDRVQANPPLLLDIADFLLSQEGTTFGRPTVAAQELDGILRGAGSVWSVLWGEIPSLVRRVTDEESEAAQVAFDSGRPGSILKRAWQAAYGRNPDPATAYREAVRAVEAAGIPVVSPRNDRATLGTMIADLRAAPQNWLVEVGGNLEQTDRVLGVATMMELLWKGQHDRHGTPNPDAPLTVSESEAGPAVHLAVLLVRWFTAGTIQRS